VAQIALTGSIARLAQAVTAVILNLREAVVPSHGRVFALNGWPSRRFRFRLLVSMTLSEAAITRTKTEAAFFGIML
jgi:hypothetical protein